MDDEQPPTGMSGSLTLVRAVVVLALFAAAVVILVAVGTRPSVSGVPSTGATTVPTTVPAGGSTTTTAAGATTTTAAATTTTHHAKKGSATTTTVAHSSVSVVVANGTSTNGLAAHYSTVIGAGGWAMKTPVDAATTVPTSAVYYAPGFQPEAAAIAATIGVKATEVLPVSSATPVSGTSGYDVIVVIGQDLSSTSST